MMIEHAYSLCDAMELAQSGALTLPAGTSLIYVGAYFCDHYFCHTPAAVWDACFSLAQRHSCGAVLVVPTPSQTQLEAVKETILRLVRAYPDVLREIVLNDYAMLLWAQETLPALPRWCGRTMSKDMRDPRYALPSQEVKLLQYAQDGALPGSPVIGVEADLLSRPALPEDRRLMLAAHVPLACVTMGRICELGSIGRPLHEKFRLTTRCRRQCTDNWLTYENNGCTFLKYGRAVYTPNDQVTALLPDQLVRVIHSALADHLPAPAGKGDTP